MRDNKMRLLPEQLRLITRLHPWYTGLLEASSITLDDLHDSPTSLLEKLPLLGADKLERYYYAQSPRTEIGLSVYRTSGTSTGIRKAIYYSEEDDSRYMEAKRKSFLAWLGERHTLTKAMADLGTGHAASTALSIFANMGMQAEAIPFTAPIDEHVGSIKHFQPQLLYTMPSILEAIAEAASDPPALGLRKIILVGELASSEWQRRMSARFGLAPADMLDTYGSIEVGAIASFDHELGRYVLADGIIGESLPAEQLGEGFQPLAEDEGVLVLTSFERSLFPVIRYVTYDVVRDFRTVRKNGKPLQTFRCLTKRIGHELKHGEKISLYDIEEVVSKHLPHAALRVMVRDNKLKLYIAGEGWREDTASAIQADVERKIEEIGQMIQNRLLQGIEVIPTGKREQLPSGTVKSKRLYT